MMASALARNTIIGAACGVLLALPVLVTIILVTPGNPFALVAAMLPVSGAFAGAAFAASLLRADAAVTVSTGRQAV